MEPALGSGEGRESVASLARQRESVALPSWLPAGVITAVAALLSLPRLGSRVLWLDEAYTVGATNQLFDTWRNTAGTQGLYYLLVWPVSRLSTDPFWLRLPSTVFGIAALVVVFHIGRRISGRREAVLAAGGLAISWGFARYSVEARSYTLALLLVSTSWLALVAAIESKSATEGRRWWRLFFVAAALTPLAHGLATLNLPAQLGFLAFAPQDPRRLVRRAAVVAPVICAELAVLFLLGASDVGNWVDPLSLGQIQGIVQLLLGFNVTGVVLASVTAAAALIALRAHILDRSRDTWLRTVPVFWAAVPTLVLILMSLVRPYAAPRYLLATMPAYFLLIASLVVRLGPMKRLTPAVLALAGLMLIDQRHVTTNGIEDWSKLTACIAANANEGDRLVTARAHRPALDYYWDDPALATVTPLAPPERLGDVRRLYTSPEESGQTLRSIMLEDSTRSIWYVDRRPGGRLEVVEMAFDQQLMARYQLKDVAYFSGDLTLARFDPKGSDRSSSATCDTIPEPDGLEPESHL